MRKMQRGKKRRNPEKGNTSPLVDEPLSKQETKDCIIIAATAREKHRHYITITSLTEN